MSEFRNYSSKVTEEATCFVDNYKEELYSELKSGDSDMNEFIHDYRLHEWVDNEFIYVDLIDSAFIIESSVNVESDSGVWEGLEPIEAVKTQAFYTFKNDVGIEVNDILSDVLSEYLEQLQDKLENLESKLEGLDEDDENDEDEIDELNEKIDELNDLIDTVENAIEEL